MPVFPRSKKPKDILAAYNEGFQGVRLDPNHLDKLLGELPHPLFGAASTYQKGNKIYSLAGSGSNTVALLFKAVRQFDQTLFEDEAQDTGDCTSHGTRNSADLTRAVEIFINKQLEEWVARGATEMIYLFRGHSGQGMSVSRGVEFINKAGGVFLRQNYKDLGIDLSEYNYKIGLNGKQGVPNIVLAEGKKHQVKTVSLITSVEEACDALANGYGITCGSGQGFASKRDKDGFAAPKGSWSHCMAWAAVDTSYSRPGILVLNSWGIWNTGPKRHEQPEGSFWIDLDVAEKMIKARSCWAVSNFDGFPAQRLSDYGTLSVLD